MVSFLSYLKKLSSAPEVRLCPKQTMLLAGKCPCSDTAPPGQIQHFADPRKGRMGRLCVDHRLQQSDGEFLSSGAGKSLKMQLGGDLQKLGEQAPRCATHISMNSTEVLSLNGERPFLPPSAPFRGFA